MSDFPIFRHYLWAKKNDKSGVFTWLSLEQHLIDTMGVAALLWEHWLSRAQKALILQSISAVDDYDGRRLVSFLAAVHDIGKATPAFQIKSNPFLNTVDLDKALLEKLEEGGFSGVSVKKLASINQSHHALASQVLLKSYGVKDDLSAIVGSHHGKPVDEESDVEVQIQSYDTNYFQNEKLDDPVHKKWKQAQKEVLNWALESNDYDSVDELPQVNKPVQVLLAGLLIMADWIASNETYFPLIPLDRTLEIDQETRLKQGWEKWFVSRAWEPVNSDDNHFEKRFGFSPREIQEKLFNIIDQADNPGILILEAPMGVGKTEAALHTAEKLAQKKGLSGIFFGLPTQATSDGIFSRINSWLMSIAEESKIKVGLRLLHGKAAQNPVFNAIAKNVDVDGNQGGVLINEWFSGRKKAALDDIVVGTVDQFLLVALKQKHLALRHLGISRKIVIIDEVHAYDSYMNQYLLGAIRWMGAYGVPVIILSATLPSDRRQLMVKNYLMGKGIKSREIRQDLEDILSESYPLITYTDGTKIKQLKELTEKVQKKITIKNLSEESLYETIEQLIMSGGVLGIIVNTVKRAQEIARRCAFLYGEDMVELLHSSYIATERIQKEQNLLMIIGKGANRPERKIIIGTQVIEQSLDIDFDVLISDLAPMDLLIQRIGRLFRHDIQRPLAHQSPVCYILGVDSQFEFEEGSVAVYGEYLLIRTQFFLPDVILLPNDISPLVQRVYEKKDIVFDTELHVKYEKAKEKHQIELDNKSHRAKNYLLGDPQPLKEDASLIGWISNCTVDDSEEKGYAQVRDSKDTLEIIALRKVGEGYGLFDEEVDLVSKLDEFGVAKSVAQHTLRLPYTLCAYRSPLKNIDTLISELEKYRKVNLPEWDEITWLKGSLGVIFDDNNQFILNGYLLTYDKKYGLTYERM